MQQPLYQFMVRKPVREYSNDYLYISENIADCQPKRTPVPYSADSLRHN